MCYLSFNIRTVHHHYHPTLKHLVIQVEFVTPWKTCGQFRIQDFSNVFAIKQKFVA